MYADVFEFNGMKLHLVTQNRQIPIHGTFMAANMKIP